jgi:GTPase SAR1 family protein
MADGLRIVLFGAPGSGKSSLVGALVQAGQSQTAQLGGQLVDIGGGMAELKSQLYQKGPAPTEEDLKDYPLTLEPLASGPGSRINATLTDCSGQAAAAMLGAKTSLPADSPLGQALLQADALMLLVDASASPDRDLAHIGQFLQLFQQVRGARADIAGLPIYLVLSKCDLIAKPGDTYNQWVQRIEESKRKLDQRLRTIMEEQAEAPFGSVDLHIWATAVKRPGFADHAAKPEPFGVAELFRQGLASAQAYQAHREHASGRLSLAVTGMLGLVAVLGLLAGMLYMLRPSLELTALENRIRRVLPGPSATDRLREPLDDRLKELEQIQETSQFAELQPKLRDEVKQARDEIELYQKYHKDFVTQITDPRYATRDEELDQIDKSLNAFTLPLEYLASWSETKLVQRLQRWRLDVQKLREAAKDEIAWMQQQVEEGQALVKQGGLVLAKSLPAEQRDQWFKQVQAYLDREPRHKRSDRLAANASVTYDHVYKLQRVEQARKAWDRVKDNLKDLRKLAQ